MAEEKEKRKFIKKIKDKYRFVIYNDTTFEEVLHFRLSRLNVFAYVGISVVLIATLVVILIVFTPLREFIPQYPDSVLQREIVENALRVDSLEQELRVRDQYFNNIKTIIEGKEPDNFVSAQDTTTEYKEISFDKSIQDSILRQQVEAEEQYNLANIEDPFMMQSISSLDFFAPINKGVITNPFNLKEGLVQTANGKTYDMGDKHQRQACFDEGMAHWANELTAAVKSVDPEAMVTTGMWTSNAQDREPVNYLLEPRVDDRYPPRPSVLAGPGCELDFIDIHIYPFHGGTGINLEACEYDQLKSLGAPVLCGEYGIFRHLTEPEEAIQQERQLRGNIQDLGFAGPLLWVWDLIANSNTYTAEELGMR